MFTKDEPVEVCFIHSGHHDPLWHRGVIVGPVQGSASYQVSVGGVVTQATPANIRKV